MKSSTGKLSIGLFIILSALSSCVQIKGDGNVITEQRSISSFNKLEANGIFNLYISQGDTESIKIEADKNLLAFIKTKNERDKLSIKMETDGKNINATKLNVYLTVKNIEKFEFNMVGDIETTSAIHVNNLAISGSGVGNSNLELYCEKVDGEFSTVGNVTLKGRIQNLNMTSEGVGDINAFDLNTDTLVLSSDGVGDVEVAAEKEISITSSGVGSVKYKGNAVVKEMNASGIGKVKKV